MKTATLALDLGTRTGYALLRPDGKIESGSFSFQPQAHEGDGARFLKFRAWLVGVKFHLEQADIAIGQIHYERVDFIPQQRTGPRAVHIWGGMWATLTAWAEHHQIPYGDGVAVGSLKAAICGNGRATKPEIIKAVRARGFAPADHNEADALALLLMHLPAPAAAA